MSDELRTPARTTRCRRLGATVRGASARQSWPTATISTRTSQQRTSPIAAVASATSARPLPACCSCGRRCSRCTAQLHNRPPVEPATLLRPPPPALTPPPPPPPPPPSAASPPPLGQLRVASTTVAAAAAAACPAAGGRPPARHALQPRPGLDARRRRESGGAGHAVAVGAGAGGAAHLLNQRTRGHLSAPAGRLRPRPRRQPAGQAGAPPSPAPLPPPPDPPTRVAVDHERFVVLDAGPLPRRTQPQRQSAAIAAATYRASATRRRRSCTSPTTARWRRRAWSAPTRSSALTRRRPAPRVGLCPHCPTGAVAPPIDDGHGPFTSWDGIAGRAVRKGEARPLQPERAGPPRSAARPRPCGRHRRAGSASVQRHATRGVATPRPPPWHGRRRDGADAGRRDVRAALAPLLRARRSASAASGGTSGSRAAGDATGSCPSRSPPCGRAIAVGRRRSSPRCSTRPGAVELDVAEAAWYTAGAARRAAASPAPASAAAAARRRATPPVYTGFRGAN